MTDKKRLIDANSIKYRTQTECYGHGWYEEVISVTKEEIDKIPTVDAVEVVRCKDCVYWDGRGYDGRCEGYANGLIRDYTNFDDFCSYGERSDT